jgi:outer membrane scaffolding protein for murein synthesis (MipA/OmpV family)
VSIDLVHAQGAQYATTQVVKTNLNNVPGQELLVKAGEAIYTPPKPGDRSEADGNKDTFMTTWTRAAGAVLLLAAAGGARADIPPFYALGERPAEDLYALGALFFAAPRFAGSEETRRVFRPSATVMLRNGFFADPISGVGFNASTDPRFEYGARATLGLGREASDAAPQLGRIADSLNIGGFANMNATSRLTLQSALRHGGGRGHDGTLVDVGASFDLLQWNHGSLSVEASESFASSRYMRSYYGVGGGPQWTTGGISVTTPLHPKVLAVVSVDRTWLPHAVAESPLVKRSHWSSLQATIAIAF